MRIRNTVLALLLVIVSLPAFAQRDWGHGPQPRSGACFYQNEGFGGNYFCMKIGDRWASLPPGFNDHISSIRVFGGARVRVFNDGNFRGISLRLDRDAFNLREIRIPDAPQKSWNDRISSIAVFGDRDEWDDHRDWHDRH